MAKEPSSKLSLILFGKTGTGKSTLINSLFCTPLAKIGGTLRSETKLVGSYTRTINFTVKNICVTVWDTPGLKDPESDGKKTIKEIREKCGSQGIDLFVYCTKFDQPRLEQDDVDCIHDITKAFGDGIWKRALFALTCANNVTTVPPSVTDKSLSQYFQFRLEQWREGLQHFVKKNATEISDEVNSIPVVPTGYISPDKNLPLPDNRFWWFEFFSACLTRVNFLAFPAMTYMVDGLVSSQTERAAIAEVAEERMANEPESADKAQVAVRLAPLLGSANHGATTPSSTTQENEPTIQGNTTTPSGQGGGTLTTSTVDSTTNGDSPDGGIAATPNGSSTPESGVSAATESTDGNNGAQGFVGKKLTAYLDKLATMGIGGCILDVKGDLEACVGKELNEKDVQKAMEAIDFDISAAEITSLNVKEDPFSKKIEGRVKLTNPDHEENRIPYGPVVIEGTDTIEKWKEKTRGWSFSPSVGVSHYGSASGTVVYSRGKGEKLVTKESSTTSVTHQRDIKVGPRSSCIAAVELVERQHIINVKGLLLEFPSDTKLKTKKYWPKEKLSKILKIKSEKDGKIIAESDGKVQVMETTSSVETYPPN